MPCKLERMELLMKKELIEFYNDALLLANCVELESRGCFPAAGFGQSKRQVH